LLEVIETHALIASFVTSGHTTADKNKLINVTQLCDGIVHCQEGADEHYCVTLVARMDNFTVDQLRFVGNTSSSS
jgi:hypothetical protein